MTRDMIKKKKQGFSFMLQKCKIWHFLKITVLTFFIISPVIFGLQRRTLPQIKALEILFWPWFIIFSSKINICWGIMSKSCIVFFPQSLLCYLPKYILIREDFFINCRSLEMVALVLYTKLNYVKLAKWWPSRKCSKIKGKDFTQFLGDLVARLILRDL